MTEARARDDKVHELTQDLLKRLNEVVNSDDLAPIGDRVLVNPMERDHVQKKSEIYVVKETENKVRYSLVLRKPTGDKSPRMQSLLDDIEVGDVIIHGRYVGHPVKWGDEDLRLIQVGDILAVYEDFEGF